MRTSTTWATIFGLAVANFLATVPAGSYLSAGLSGAATPAPPRQEPLHGIGPHELRLSRETKVVGAVYTPFVIAAVQARHSADVAIAPGARSTSGVGDGLVYVAFRGPGNAPAEVASLPYSLVIADRIEAMVWHEAGAQHPTWVEPAPATAARVGIRELNSFDVVAAFKPEQLSKGKFAVLYRGTRTLTEFSGAALPDPAALRWR